MVGDFPKPIWCLFFNLLIERLCRGQKIKRQIKKPGEIMRKGSLIMLIVPVSLQFKLSSFEGFVSFRTGFKMFCPRFYKFHYFG